VPSDKPLDGLKILVTRPERQADNFCRLIEAAGGEAVRFPTLEIQALSPPANVFKDAEHLGRFDWLVFVSANAVYFALKACDNALSVPAHTKVAAIGRATASALEESGVPVNLEPEGRFDSEAFLDLAPMQQVAGLRFLIIRGEGGRELLADTLQQRGAHVIYAEVYRRLRPKVDIASHLTSWRSRGIDAVTIFSGESLVNFIAMLGDNGLGWAQEIPLVVAGARIAAQARQEGFDKVILASNATDWALFKALAGFRSESNENDSGPERADIYDGDKPSKM
jgi:uroporphyrinogen-III synthase